MVGSIETTVRSLDSEMNEVSDTLGEEQKLSIERSHDSERLTVTDAGDMPSTVEHVSHDARRDPSQRVLGER
jgi:hypothetical protein